MTTASNHAPRDLAPDLARKLVAEAVGTALLLATVVGSGIMADRLCGGNVGLALLANTAATAAMLLALIATFGALSGAHFNPVVSCVDAWMGKLPWRQVPPYIMAQIGGAFAGVVVANLMFDLPALSVATTVRTGSGQWLAEGVATFGLIAVILGTVAHHAKLVPVTVAAYITAGYWFTSSTSFANPAVTLARTASNSFAGIRPVDVPGFIVAQLLGAGAAAILLRWLLGAASRPASGGR